MRGVPEAVQRLRRIVEQGDTPFVNDIVTAEAWAGAPSDDDRALTNLLELLEFIAAGRLMPGRPVGGAPDREPQDATSASRMR